MDLLKLAKELRFVAKSWPGIFSLIILGMAGLCAAALKEIKPSPPPSTINLLLVGCIVVILCTLGILFYLSMRHPGGLEKQVRIQDEVFCFFLRGLKHHYLLSAEQAKSVRVNIMLPVTVNGHKALRISLMDYAEAYSDDERSRYWREGRGKCGVAWQSREQQFFAVGDSSAVAQAAPMDGDTFSLKSLQSVLSTPIVWQDACLGVLNMDSREAPTVTLVNSSAVRALFMHAATTIAPLLSDFSRSNNRG